MIAIPINKKIYSRNILVFISFYIIFFTYQYNTYFDSTIWQVVMNLLIFVVFLVSSFKPLYGLYFFIFTIPLFNSLTTILEIRPVPILILLFSGFFMGFLLNYFEQDLKDRFSLHGPKLFLDRELYLPVVLFMILVFISALIASARYINFFPFITNDYHNLMVNIKELDSTSAVYVMANRAMEYLCGFALMAAVFNIVRRLREIVRAAIVMIVSATLASMMAVYQYFINPFIGSFRYWVETGRLNATFTDPNALGAYCIMAFPIFLGLIIYFKKWYLKMILSALLVLFVFASFVSGSRSSLVSIVIATIIFIALGILRVLKNPGKISKTTRIKISAGTISFLAIIVIFFIVILAVDNPVKRELFRIGIIQRTAETFGTFISYLKTSGLNEALKSISNNRYIFWQQAINMLKGNAVAGVGNGAYIVEIPDFLYRYEPGFVQVDYAGNFYLQTLAELGLTGFFALIAFFFMVIKKIFRFSRAKNNTDFKNGAFLKFLNQLKQTEWIYVGLAVSFITMLVGLIFGSHTNFIEIQLMFFLIIGLLLAYLKVGSKILSLANYNDLNTTVGVKKSIGFPNFLIVSNRGFNRFDLKTGRTRKIILSLILVIFTTSFFAASITNLSIAAKQDSCYWFNEYGFYKFESIQDQKARWVGPDAGTIIDGRTGNYLIIPIQDYTPKKINSRNTVNIFIDNILVKRVKLEQSNKWYDIKVPIPAFTQNRFTLTIVSSRSWIPAEVGLNADSRELAAIVGEFQFAN